MAINPPTYHLFGAPKISYNELKQDTNLPDVAIASFVKEETLAYKANKKGRKAK